MPDEPDNRDGMDAEDAVYDISDGIDLCVPVWKVALAVAFAMVFFPFFAAFFLWDALREIYGRKRGKDRA